MTYIHENGAERKVSAREIMAALIIPEHGASLHTLIAPGAPKSLAYVELSPGGGLANYERRIAVQAHTIVQTHVHAESSTGRKVSDFDESTLRWACDRSEQIAVWCERGKDHHEAVLEWLVNSAAAGSRFQTTIFTTPLHGDAWRIAVDRWKGRNSEVRMFGPEGLQ